jgi:hypothetical protein
MDILFVGVVLAAIVAATWAIYAWLRYRQDGMESVIRRWAKFRLTFPPALERHALEQRRLEEEIRKQRDQEGEREERDRFDDSG